MNQEENKSDKRQNPFSSFKRKDSGSKGPSPKGPKFSFYWIYVIAAVMLIGYQVMRGATPDASTITELEFRQKLLERNHVEKLEPVKNKGVVRVYIKQDSLSDPIYQSLIGLPAVYGYLLCYKTHDSIGLVQNSATNRRKAVYLCL